MDIIQKPLGAFVLLCIKLISDHSNHIQKETPPTARLPHQVTSKALCLRL